MKKYAVSYANLFLIQALYLFVPAIQYVLQTIDQKSNSSYSISIYKCDLIWQ